MGIRNKIKSYKKKQVLRESEREKSLGINYIKKARNNLIAMQTDFEISVNTNVQKVLNISGFKEYDWVIVKGYYSMYMAALACLAKIGLKSENHDATISALEFYFVDKGKLEKDYLEIIKNVSLEKHYIESIRNVKEDRIAAQYNVSEEFEKRKAEESIENAKKFVDRLEKLFYEIELTSIKKQGDKKKEENEKKK